MPADSGLAVVVVSHLAPEHKSALGEILARVCRIPVPEVEDGIVVEPNHVYIMPSNSEKPGPWPTRL
jgi:two-component system CheB/CheR fusion protein